MRTDSKLPAADRCGPRHPRIIPILAVLAVLAVAAACKKDDSPAEGRVRDTGTGAASDAAHGKSMDCGPSEFPETQALGEAAKRIDADWNKRIVTLFNYEVPRAKTLSELCRIHASTLSKSGALRAQYDQAIKEYSTASRRAASDPSPENLKRKKAAEKEYGHWTNVFTHADIFMLLVNLAKKSPHQVRLARDPLGKIAVAAAFGPLHAGFELPKALDPECYVSFLVETPRYFKQYKKESPVYPEGSSCTKPLDPIRGIMWHLYSELAHKRGCKTISTSPANERVGLLYARMGFEEHPVDDDLMVIDAKVLEERFARATQPDTLNCAAQVKWPEPLQNLEN